MNSDSISTPKPIACELFDYIEIACMFSYQVKLVLRDHSVVEGKALTTEITADKQEMLIIQNKDETKLSINTATLASMTVLTAGARFNQVTFD